MSGPDVSLAVGALKIVTDAAELVSDATGQKFEKGKTYRLRVDIQSDKEYTGYHNVLFFEGDPDQGATAFAARMAYGVKKGGAMVWAGRDRKRRAKRPCMSRFWSITATPIPETRRPASPSTWSNRTARQRGKKGLRLFRGQETPQQAVPLDAALIALFLAVAVLLKRRSKSR